MKKLIFILIASLVLNSCGSSKVVDDARQTIRGDWTLSSISYPGGAGDFNVTLFGDTPISCLENSQWNFISNNNTGSYVLSGPTCDADPNFFIWSIEEVNTTNRTYDFMLKPTDERGRSISGDEGYRMNIVTLSDDNMVLENRVNFEGSPFSIRMNFNKN